jgi:hypothetical protein
MLIDPSNTRGEFVFQFADQLLQHVFHADHSRGGSEFIDHHCQVPLAELEFTEQIEQGLGFGHHQHIVHDLADLHLGNAHGSGRSGDVA